MTVEYIHQCIPTSGMKSTYTELFCQGKFSVLFFLKYSPEIFL